MAQIEDGKGTGSRAQVNSDNQLVVKAVAETLFESASENGLTYNWSSDLVNIDADDTVLLVKNMSDVALHIESISIANGSVASEYTVHLPATEVTVTAGGGGAVVTGTNLNTASSNVADVSAASDETNNTQGNVVFTRFMAVDTNEKITTAGLILGKNKSVAVDVVEDTAESAVTIRAHY